MAVSDQKKLEENPVLPLDNQNLVFTLTRVFRQLAQIVNPLVAWMTDTKAWLANLVGFSISHTPAGSTMVDVKAQPPGPGDAILRLFKSAPGGLNSVSVQGFTGDSATGIRWNVQPGNGETETGANAGTNFAIYRYSDTGAYLGNPFYIRRSDGLANFAGRLDVQGALNVGGATLVANTFNATGVATFSSTASVAGAATFSSSVWAGARITGNSAEGAALYAPNGGVNISHTYGVQVGGYHEGSGAAYSNITVGNPNYQNLNYYLVHVYGVWAGHEWAVNGQGFRFRQDGWAEGPAGFRATSDSRVKTNVAPIANALFKCGFLTGYTYERLDLNDYAGTRLRMAGLIANQVQQVFPAAVYRAPVTEADPDPKRSLTYDAITALLLTAINELHTKHKALDTRVTTLDTTARVTALEGQVAGLNTQIAALDARITALEGA